jgi:transcriptional regulator with XRE-family HTH domain
MTTAYDIEIPLFTQGDRIRKAIEIRGFSVQEAALHFGVSRTTISNWIHDRHEPSLTELREWAEWTKVTVEWLQTGLVPPSGDGSAQIHRRFGHADRFARSAPFLPVHVTQGRLATAA